MIQSIDDGGTWLEGGGGVAPNPPPPSPRPTLSPLMAHHRTRSANTSNTQPPLLPINSNNKNNDVEEHIYSMLSSYMESMHDSKLYTRLHTKLNNLSSSGGGCGVSTAAKYDSTLTVI